MIDLTEHEPRRLDFATTRELCMLANRNLVRASYAALALLYPDALEMEGSTVDMRLRAVGSIYELGGMVMERAVRRGVAEGDVIELVDGVWPALVARAFPSEQEVVAEVGNS